MGSPNMAVVAQTLAERNSQAASRSQQVSAGGCIQEVTARTVAMRSWAAADSEAPGNPAGRPRVGAMRKPCNPAVVAAVVAPVVAVQHGGVWRMAVRRRRGTQAHGQQHVASQAPRSAPSERQHQ